VAYIQQKATQKTFGQLGNFCHQNIFVTAWINKNKSNELLLTSYTKYFAHKNINTYSSDTPSKDFR